MKNDPVERALASLDDVPFGTSEGHRQLATALASKCNLVTAKAAKIIGDGQWPDLGNELASAFNRLLKGGTAADKGYAAKISIIRALNQLEYDGADLFLSGMKHVQMEPSWGPPVDTAAELRAACAIGLAGSTCYFKLRELVDLLLDREWIARAGASRRPDAIDGLKDLLLSLATSRVETAIEFLLDLIREGSSATAALAVSALGVCRDDPGIQADIARALTSAAGNQVPRTKQA